MSEPRKCDDCDRPALGRGRTCLACGLERMVEANRQLRAREGPIYDRYKRGVEAARANTAAGGARRKAS